MSTVWYLGPGGMSGAAIAGTMCRLEEEGYKFPETDAFYAASCSAIIGAAALTGQARNGAPVYLEDVVGSRYIRLSPLKLMLRPHQHLISKVMDTDYLVEQLQKRIDLHRVQDITNPFYIKLLNEDTNQVEYMDARSEHIVDIIRAAVNLRPFNNDEVIINGQRYSDAANLETIGLLGLLKREGFIDGSVQSIDEVDELPLRDDNLYVLMGRPMHCMLKPQDSRGYRLFMRRTCTLEQRNNSRKKELQEVADVHAMMRIGDQATLYHPQSDLVRSHTTDAERVETFFHEGYVLGGALLRDLEHRKAA